jgi:hypothetical protein
VDVGGRFEQRGDVRIFSFDGVSGIGVRGEWVQSGAFSVAITGYTKPASFLDGMTTGGTVGTHAIVTFVAFVIAIVVSVIPQCIVSVGAAPYSCGVCVRACGASVLNG